MAEESGQSPDDELSPEILAAARQINEAFEAMCQEEVLKYINVARSMFEAQQSLTGTQFEQLWAATDHLMRIKFDLKRFLYVGEKLGDTEPELCRDLPRHWAILYSFAQVERDLILSGVKSGKIHRTMSLKDAERLLGVSRYGPEGPAEDEDPAMYVLDDLAHDLQELGLELEGPGLPPDEYSFCGEVHGHDCQLFLELLDNARGVVAGAQIYLSDRTTEYVEWNKELPLNITAKRIYGAILRTARELDKPSFRSRFRIQNMDLD